MKKIEFIIVISLLISGCSTTKETHISRVEKRQSTKIAELAVIKKAVESRRYIIRMERIYLINGGFMELVPKNNYIIVDGGAASVSLGYVGRSFATRPISGINFNGQTIKYNLETKEGKGTYNVSMEVNYRNDKFDLYLDIASDGYCNVSLINANIQTVNYYGQLIPIGGPLPGPANDQKTDRL
jgi:hypothetical protein